MTADVPGVYGQGVLHVDVDTGESKIEAHDHETVTRFLGGNGFAAHLVHEHVPSNVGPFDRENAVVFAVGPMNLTPFQSTSRGVVGFISPLTDGFFDSTFGGTFPAAQKSTGFDAIVLHGKADDLSYVTIDEQGAEIHEASDLEGMSTYEACRTIREREGIGYDTHVIATGPAGENRVRFANLLHDSERREGVAGRGGSGAVLGAKQIKGVAIREGDFEPEPADEEALRTIALDRMQPLMEESESLQTFGTPAGVNPVNEMGKLGRRNNHSEQLPTEDAESISGERLREEYVTADTTCANCAVQCGKRVSVDSIGLHDAKIPEFESIFATGTMPDVYNIDRIIEATDACDRLGMDTISFGVTVAFARECYEKGYLPDGIDNPSILEFGDAEGLATLARITASRSGIGDRLAEGSFRMARDLSHPDVEKFLHGTKGLEYAAHSPRGLKGMSIGYATSTRGGSHHDTRPTRQYAGDHAETTDGTAEFAARSQHYTALGDSLTQCRFVSESGWGPEINERFARAVNAATGWDLSVKDLEEIGERVYNLERLINVERGVASRSQDTLSHRVMHEPIPDGPSEGMYCPPAELEAMLDEYYTYRGWDDSGIPTQETLERLSLRGHIE